ncbi:alanine--tRNA ligase [Candidatus Aenigmatarchaeota archaeon]
MSSNLNKKEQLTQRFSKDHEKFYKVSLFEEHGFTRQKCQKCGSFFWSISERKLCPNPPCTQYEFIGKKLTKKKFDYIQTWKAIERFFVKNKHTSVESYPVVCRWFPGLYYTVASIVAFQRSVADRTTFEFPANPLIVPQQCLRFNDIPNVGVTGRHLTNFVMIGQHAKYSDDRPRAGYWKDRCIELDYELLTKVFGISPDEISFLEEVWLGPNAFGSSLEYFVRGLELGNAVFTEFVGTPENHTKMDFKVIDMGAGLERFTWLSQGTPTCYDAIFGPLMNKLKRKINFDKKFFKEYSKISATLDIEDVKDYKLAKKRVAEQLGISYEKLIEKTGPAEAVYAIADHAKTLLYSITDGLLPSNVGGGYNLRVILRRALSFIDEYDIDIDILDVCNAHALYLKKFSPRITKDLDNVSDIINTEKDRFKTMKKRSASTIENLIKKDIALDNDKLSELYESHGITPELIKEVGKKLNIDVKIPPNFYREISEKHMKDNSKEGLDIDLSGLPATETLFYKNTKGSEFDAKVLKIIDNKYVVLDKTLFYGRSGGQEPDSGFLDENTVYDVEKIGNIIVHVIESPTIKKGNTVHGKIDINRRKQLARHHTAIHIINGAARKVLGNHVWQAGAHKTIKKAHIDLTHYKPLTLEELEKIEKKANDIVKKKLRIKKTVMPRTKAEKLYGIKIYQGGAVPEKELRIISITGVDTEACGGTHLDNTKDAGKIIITSAERIQDGIVRLTLVSGEAANDYLEEKTLLLIQIKRILGTDEKNILKSTEKLFNEWKSSKKSIEKQKEHKAEDVASFLSKRMVKKTIIGKIQDGDHKLIQKVSKILSDNDRLVILFGISDKIYVIGSAGQKTGVNIGDIIKRACEDLGGRGGGSSQLGQGIGFDKAKLDDVIKILWREMVTK